MSAKRVFFGALQKIVVICCTIFFGFTNAFSANLPSGYTELEYIESTGSQYINTEIGTSSITKTEVVGQFTGLANNTFIFGKTNNNTSRYGWGEYIYPYGAANKFLWNYGGWGVVTNADLNKHTFGIDTKNGLVYIDNTQFDTSQTSNAGANPAFVADNLPIYLFARNSGGVVGYAKAKIYSVKMWNNNELTHDFVPAENSSGVVGLYDTVNNRFYTNAGTGEFTAGPVVGIRIATTAYNTARFNPVQTDLDSAVATIREIVTKTINQTAAIASLQADKQTRPEDACPAGKKCLLVEDNNGKPHWFPIIENICGVPSGYTCLDYIQASGTQYIDTGIVPTLTSGAQIRVKFLALKDADNVIFGATDSTAYAGGSPFSIDVFTNSVLMPFGGGANNSVNYSPTISKTMETNVLYDFKLNYLNDKKAVINDVVRATYTAPVSMTSRSLLLFDLNSSAGGMSRYAAKKSQIFSAVITNGSNIVFNGVPAKRDSDGVIGMYDTVSDRFLTNAGTGTFTAGPEI